MTIFLLSVSFLSLLFSSISILAILGIISFEKTSNQVESTNDKYSDYRNESGLLTRKSKAFKITR